MMRVSVDAPSAQEEKSVSPKFSALEIEEPSLVRAQAFDPHAVTGGDLTSAVLGIIKGMVGPAILCKRPLPLLL